jgi:hypothetical protein
MLGADGTGRGEEESSFDVTAGISMVELEFAVVEFMISSLEGVYTPPIKMDCFENKGVAGRAFCKWLKRKRMDDSKEGQMRREMEGTARKRRSARVRSINHDPCYHELYCLSNDIIVLVFRKLTYLFERFCKTKKTKE